MYLKKVKRKKTNPTFIKGTVKIRDKNIVFVVKCIILHSYSRFITGIVTILTMFCSFNRCYFLVGIVSCRRIVSLLRDILVLFHPSQQGVPPKCKQWKLGRPSLTGVLTPSQTKPNIAQLGNYPCSLSRVWGFLDSGYRLFAELGRGRTLHRNGNPGF